MLASDIHNLEDPELMGLQSAKEVCAESATCPNIGEFRLLDDERSQITWGKTHTRTFTLKFDVSSGTYQMPQDTEKISFVDSPFDELDERLPDKDKIYRSLESVRHNKYISYAQRLADRLRYLYESVLEDSDEGPIPPDSLINFLYFLKKTPGL
ncbi:MAG: hypothetical protein EHM79_21315, partial [Geobacter sp.]